MAYKIELSAGHPKSEMIRAGIRVTYGKAAILDEVPKEIKIDPWFRISKINKSQVESLIAEGAAIDYREEKAFTEPVKEKTRSRSNGDLLHPDAVDK